MFHFRNGTNRRYFVRCDDPKWSPFGENLGSLLLVVRQNTSPDDVGLPHYKLAFPPFYGGATKVFLIIFSKPFSRESREDNPSHRATTVYVLRGALEQYGRALWYFLKNKKFLDQKSKYANF